MNPDDFDGMKMKKVLVTPTLAVDYLKKNIINRPMRDGLIDTYARDMKNGAWVLNHQGIAFDSEGNLLDGQHRLNAIIRSQTPTWMIISTGIPSTYKNGTTIKTMDTIDGGRPRSTGDKLALGYNVSNPFLVSSAANVIIQLALQKQGRLGRVSMAQTLDVLKIYGTHIDHLVAHVAMLNGLRTGTVLGSLAFARAIPAMVPFVDKFFIGLMDGENLTKTSPVLILRNDLLSDRKKICNRGSINRKNTAILVLQCLYNFVHSKPMKSLRFSNTGLEFFAERQKSNVYKIEAFFNLQPNQ